MAPEEDITAAAGKWTRLVKEIGALEQFAKSVTEETLDSFKSGLTSLNDWFAKAGVVPNASEGLAFNEPIWNTSGQPIYGSRKAVEVIEDPAVSADTEILADPKPAKRDDIEPTRHFA